MEVIRWRNIKDDKYNLRVLRRKNNFHNINNLAVKPKRFLEKIYEKVADYLMIKSVDNFICVSNISETF